MERRGEFPTRHPREERESAGPEAHRKWRPSDGAAAEAADDKAEGAEREEPKEEEGQQEGEEERRMGRHPVVATQPR